MKKSRFDIKPNIKIILLFDEMSIMNTVLWYDNTLFIHDESAKAGTISNENAIIPYSLILKSTKEGTTFKENRDTTIFNNL